MFPTLSRTLPLALFLLATAPVQAQTPTSSAAQARAPLISKLPLQDALRHVQGNGKRQLVVFSDPNCPYCRRLEQELLQLKDVTIHTFLIPVLGADSVDKAQRIWCAADNAEAWRAWMLKAQAPAPARCEAPVDVQALTRNLALAKSLRIAGTPGIVLADGRVLLGLRSAAVLDTEL